MHIAFMQSGNNMDRNFMVFNFSNNFHLRKSISVLIHYTFTSPKPQNGTDPLMGIAKCGGGELGVWRRLGGGGGRVAVEVDIYTLLTFIKCKRKYVHSENYF